MICRTGAIILYTIKGTGPSIAIGVLLEIEDVKKFATAKQLYSFSGVLRFSKKVEIITRAIGD